MKFGHLLGATLFFLLFAFMFGPLAGGALMAAIMVHELGHLFTAKMFGVKTGGIYFVPFFGAIMPMGKVPSLHAEAAIAAMGPVVGSLAAIAAGVAYLYTGEPIAAGLGCLMALLNLFNMVPAHPMDGGRVAKAVIGSFSPRLGLAYAALCVVACLILGVYYSPIFLLVAWLGFMECRGGRLLLLREEDRQRIIAALADIHGTEAKAEPVLAGVQRYLDETAGMDGIAFMRNAPVAAALEARVPHKGFFDAHPRHVISEEELQIEDASDVQGSSLGKFLSAGHPPGMSAARSVAWIIGSLVFGAALLWYTLTLANIMSPLETFRFLAARQGYGGSL